MAVVKEDHPDEILTASYLEGNLEGSARDTFESHLAACADCRDGVTLLAGGAESQPAPREMIEKARAFEGGTRASRPAMKNEGSMMRIGLPAALAAGLLIALAAAWWPRGPEAPAPGVERSAEPSSLRAIAPAAGAQLGSTDIIFTWSPVAGADRYVVSVSRVDGTVTETFEVRAPSASVVLGNDRPALSAGRYLWSVRALSLDRVLDETRPVPFEIK